MYILDYKQFYYHTFVIQNYYIRSDYYIYYVYYYKSDYSVISNKCMWSKTDSVNTVYYMVTLSKSSPEQTSLTGQMMSGDLLLLLSLISGLKKGNMASVK